MEELKTTALVIGEKQIGEADKLLTLLTPEHGKLTVSGKGVSSLRSRHMAACQLFCYSNFVFRKSKKYYYISDSDTEECFFNIRFDVEKVALAAYMCDVACDLSLENVGDEELLRLMLNSLYALANKKNVTLDHIKAAFEFRAAVIGGFLPILDVCGVCGCEVGCGDVVFDVMNGMFRCAKCTNAIEREGIDPNGTAEIYHRINPTVLSALRFIANAPITKFLSFQIPPEDMGMLASFAESYLISHLEHPFSSLKYFKDIRLNGINYE